MREYLEDEELEMEEIDSYDELTEDQQDLVDCIFDEIIELGCEHCIKNVLSELFLMGWEEGSDSSLLALSDGLRDLVFNREE